MRASLERYFKAIQATIANVPGIATSDLSFETRSASIGFVRGAVYFTDGSHLRFRELLDVQKRAAPLLYVYHYQDADGGLVFRYDNTRHFLHLPRFPHHKQVGREDDVIAHEAPTLGQVLNEIAALEHP